MTACIPINLTVLTLLLKIFPKTCGSDQTCFLLIVWLQPHRKAHSEWWREIKRTGGVRVKIVQTYSKITTTWEMYNRHFQAKCGRTGMWSHKIQSLWSDLKNHINVTYVTAGTGLIGHGLFLCIIKWYSHNVTLALYVWPLISMLL